MATRLKNIHNAEHYTWGGVCDGWRLLDGADLSVIQEQIPPGHGEVKHVHTTSRQFFYVLSGALQIDVGPESLRLDGGDSLEIPPSIHHKVWNPFQDTAVFLVVSSPSTRNDRINLE
ncbi:MAG TPA: cupin domain-containing protein [Bacteroidota bacterium]|nr:cupin domain-containing protein [Bacteroidota bacterium]